MLFYIILYLFILYLFIYFENDSFDNNRYDVRSTVCKGEGSDGIKSAATYDFVEEMRAAEAPPCRDSRTITLL